MICLDDPKIQIKCDKEPTRWPEEKRTISQKRQTIVHNIYNVLDNKDDQQYFFIFSNFSKSINKYK